MVKPFVASANPAAPLLKPSAPARRPAIGPSKIKSGAKSARSRCSLKDASPSFRVS